MAERRGRSVAAVVKGLAAAAVMGLVTLALAAAGARLAYDAFGDLVNTECFVCMGDTFAWVSGLAASLGTIALLVAGGWAAVRLARGRRVGALGVVFAALVVAAGVFWGLHVLILFGNWDKCSSAFMCGAGMWVMPLALSAVCLAGGLVTAWRVAQGPTRYALDDDGSRSDSADAWCAWVVAEPGADLRKHLLFDEVTAHLEPGTVVWEVRRYGESVWVRLPDGQEGCVAADRLVPTGVGEAERPVPCWRCGQYAGDAQDTCPHCHAALV